MNDRTARVRVAGRGGILAFARGPAHAAAGEAASAL